jgi:hypothetical protein
MNRDDPDYVVTPKFVKDRLIRIETRLVKYQESNVVLMDAMVAAISTLSHSVEKLIAEVELLTEPEVTTLEELEVHTDG